MGKHSKPEGSPSFAFRRKTSMEEAAFQLENDLIYDEEPVKEDVSVPAPVYEPEDEFTDNFPQNEDLSANSDTYLYESDNFIEDSEHPGEVSADWNEAPAAPARSVRKGSQQTKSKKRANSEVSAENKTTLKKQPRKKNEPEKSNEEEEMAWDVPLHKKNRFGRRLVTYVMILCAIIVVALAVVWVLLGNWQKKKDAEAAAEAERLAVIQAQQEYDESVRRAPQLAFEAWMDTVTPDFWANLWYESNPEDIDGRERVVSFMSDLFSAEKVSAFKSLDFTEETPIYVLKNDTEVLARITMSGKDLDWDVSSAEILLKGEESASLKVAVGSTVFCNGKELTTEYAGESVSTFSYEPLIDKLVNPTQWTTYTVSGMLLEPELSVTPPDGCSITETVEGDYLLCLNEEAGATYQTKATAFVKAYLFYYLSGLNGTYGNLYNALAYVNAGTQAYTDLQDTYNGVVWNSAHTNIDTSNVTAGDVVIWADNCYSVDVTYDATGNVGGQVDEYAATMRVYFMDSGAGFGISAFETL